MSSFFFVPTIRLLKPTAQVLLCLAALRSTGWLAENPLCSDWLADCSGWLAGSLGYSWYTTPLGLSAKRTTAARLIPKHSQTLPNTPKHSQTLPNIPKLGHREIWHPFWDTPRSGILPIILKNLTQPSQRQSGGAATAVLTVPII